jgi:ketosteroid isomerase-like protein
MRSGEILAFMALSDIEVIRDQYVASNERDFERAMSHYADDVVLVVVDGPTSGTFEGVKAVGAWFGDWFATFHPQSQFEVTELSKRDDDQVLLVADMHAIGRGSGIEIVGEVIWLYRLREGKIIRVEGGMTRDVRGKLGLE